MSSHHFFVYRPASPASFQLVRQDLYSLTATQSNAPFPAGPWTLQRFPEAPISSRFVEHASELFLENGGHQYRLCVPRPGTRLPPRGACEVARDSLQGSMDLRLLLRQWLSDPTVAPPPVGARVLPFVRTAVVPTAAVASHDIDLSRLPRPLLGANDVRVAPIPFRTPNNPPPRPAVTTKALPAFTAGLILEALRAKNTECPVTMEPLASLTAVAVAPCGHACDAEVSKRLTSCPVCREGCQWTVVAAVTAS
jgi:hypothetical protein